MGDEPDSKFEWAREFKPTPDEQRVVKAAAAGEWCIFTEPATLRGDFIRILMLSVRRDWPVAPDGVMIGAETPTDDDAERLLTIDGAIELRDARANDGRALPPLYIRNAHFTDKLRLIGAHVKHFDLAGGRNVRIAAEYMTVDRNVSLNDCRCVGEIRFGGATIGGQFIANDVRFNNEGGDALDLQGATVTGGVSLRGANATGRIYASGLITDGPFSASGATFDNKNGDALDLHDASIKGGVFLRGAKATGRIYAAGISTDYQFLVTDAVLKKDGGDALNLHGARTKGDVHLDNARVLGRIYAVGLTTDSQFNAEGAVLQNAGAEALNLQSAVAKGGVFLNYADVSGCVNAPMLSTDTQFAALGASFKNRGEDALILQNATVAGGVYLNDITALGRVRANGLSTNGPFVADAAKLDNPGGPALNLQMAMIKTHVSLMPDEQGAPTIICGEANFMHAHVGSFHAESARLKYPDDDALVLFGTVITKNLWLADCELDGNLSGCGMVVGGEVRFDGTRPGSSGICDMDFRQVEINGVLTASGLGVNAWGRRVGKVDLTGAHIARIDDSLPPELPVEKLKRPWLLTEQDRKARRGQARERTRHARLQDGWPEKIIFDRATYNSISIQTDNRDAKAIAKRRVRWLLREYFPNEKPKEGAFNPQPFEQLAKTLRAQGEGEAANLVTIERQRLERKCANRKVAMGLNLLLDVTARYGYAPARIVGFFVGWWLLGGFLALWLDMAHGFQPQLKVSTNPDNFEPFIYALDLITPLIEFGQAENFRITPACWGWDGSAFLRRAGCQWREWVQALYAVGGYALFSILVLTLTGVLRRD
ncbi:MAG: hypothetical protein AAFX08_06185 [Pseudomonadota bacterium]